MEEDELIIVKESLTNKDRMTVLNVSRAMHGVLHIDQMHHTTATDQVQVHWSDQGMYGRGKENTT